MNATIKKFLYQPLDPFVITQGFGENRACLNLATQKVVSCDGRNPPPNHKSLYGQEGHLGIDLRLVKGRGQPCYAASFGEVEKIDTDPRTGLDVRIVTEFEGQKYRHIYEHLMGYNVVVGQKVSLGDLIGWCDNTGWSSSDHLHFQLERWENKRWKPVNPLDFMHPSFALRAAGLLRRIAEALAALSEVLADRLRGGKM